MIRYPKNKYGNKKTTIDGLTFDSQKEARIWQRLVLEAKAGIITGLQRQVAYEFPDNFGNVIRHVKSKRPVKYVADFVYIKNGQKIVADAKGFRTAEYKLKAALMKSLLNIEILEL